jgi:Co/Zn/Cd efflux system component
LQHVFADTLRSISVLSAGGIAYYTNLIDASTADAAAAFSVSLIIFFSCIPLIQGIYNTLHEIIALRRQKPPST